MNQDSKVPVVAPQLYVRDSSDEELIQCIINWVRKGNL